MLPRPPILQSPTPPSRLQLECLRQRMVQCVHRHERFLYFTHPTEDGVRALRLAVLDDDTMDITIVQGRGGRDYDDEAAARACNLDWETHVCRVLEGRPHILSSPVNSAPYKVAP